MVSLALAPAPVAQPEARALQVVLAANAILPLPVQELLSRVEQELAENPVLERVPWTCPQCGTEAEGISCGRCGYGLLGGSGRFRWEWGDPGTRKERPSALEFVRAPTNLLDHLEAQLRVSLRDPRLQRVALHLLGYLDPRGYFDGELRYVAAELGVPEALAERALRAVQALEPAGIGARDLRECLLLQLERLPDHPLRDLARTLVAHHLEELARGRHEAVATRLGVRPETVHEALQYLRTHTVPAPTEAFHAEHGGREVRPEELAVPDVVLTRTEEGYRVELVASGALALRINPLVRRALLTADLLPEERDRLRAHLRRGRLFIEAVRRRNTMLYRCAEFLARYQRAFLDHGPRCLRPLTLTQVARELGVWESTVSRAVAGKFVQMPDGRVVSFEVFFDGSLPIRERIREFVAAESPDRPLTDEDLVERLRAEGYRLARRTVTKYREMAGIPSARVRRRMRPA
ncbi:MAG: RNA polymerase factor sigma-54 [Armatimonadota bacterium]|nr:RNA polymerase factor sigma-54 [Armatimonadota bacterium]MDR7440343.1 RNA polymerase factor sigma-54 [Armatimonadota bacterium]MDR7562470.1 RNA polymerase factor sigma-54 [Armatimonadota bacterium]MDR7566826.1 RNA polymerase factor sigma-54 [Armatimonadota bacterium]MDR7601183.1 RNA polymerase factor sigma-54 [Armatimonadota bacterium]